MFFKKNKNLEYLKNIKPGDRFKISHGINLQYTCFVNCLNNEPENKKIYVEVPYDTGTKYEVINYNDGAFNNLTLININIQKIDIKELLKNSIKEFELKEEFDKCSIIKKVIEIL